MDTFIQRLLIADDDKPMRELLGDLFTRSGYDVRTSCDGVDALRQFYCETPDLLITDLNMPRINGYELCRRVRLVSNIPIVMMTFSDLGDGTVVRTALAAGADSILCKPFNLEELLTQVEARLTRSTTLVAQTCDC